jgi:parallel beta-helix repeat protein
MRNKGLNELIEKAITILLCVMMFNSTIIIIGNGSAGEGTAPPDEINAEHGLGGLWNPAGPRESETCRIVTPETLLRDNPNPLPSAVDNSAGLPPVGNQYSQGSCTAWAIGYYHATYIENRESPIDMTAPENQTSPAFLYNIANSGYDSGSYMQDVADLLISNGACSMAEKPYSPTDLTSWPEEDWIWVSGMKRKAIGQNWLQATESWGMDALKSHLAAGNTATTGIYVWSNFDNIGNFNYTYSSAERYGSNRGGHVVTICGYDDDFPTADGPGALRMVNSWGTSWGEAGYWWLSYGALHDYDICQSGWVMYLESEVNYKPKMVAKARIDHESRGDIFRNSGLRVIAYENDEEVWSRPFLSCHWMEYYAGTTQQHPFPAGRMAFDISDALNFMQGDFHIFVLYAENTGYVEGEIVNFEILNGEWWCGGVSSFVPISIEPFSVVEPEAWVDRGVFEHVPVRADGDAGLAQRAIGEMWEGDGTPGNPYLIHDYVIDGTGLGNCIYIGNATASFEIVDCILENASSDEWSDYHADSGILLISASGGALTGNYIAANLIGMFLIQCSDILVEGNEVQGNGYGILASECSDMTVRQNRFLDNSEFGICLEISDGIEIYHNDLIDNICQAMDFEGTNTWDDGYPSGGNYWSDYAGTDIRSGPGQDQPFSDGIGDTSYGFEEGMDRYPLMRPWGTPPEPVRFGITLATGWNLISIPLNMANASVESVLSSISGTWDSVKYYDSIDSADPWKSHRPSGSSNDLAIIDMTMGIWVHVTENCTLMVDGDVPETTNILLHAGWNLVGYPSITERNVGDSLWGTSADMVEAFDPASPYLITPVEPEYIMRPGEGYWVHVPADTLWVIDW